MNNPTLLNPRELHTTSDTKDGYLTTNGTNRTLVVAETAEDPAPVFYLATNGDPVFAVHDDPKALAEFLAALADVDDDNPFQPSDANTPNSRVDAGLVVLCEAAQDVPNFLEYWEHDLLAAAAYALAESVSHAKVIVNLGEDWADTYLPANATSEDKAAALSRLAAELEAKGLEDVEFAEDEYADELEATYPDPYETNGEGIEVEDEVLAEIKRIVTTALADSYWQDEPAE